MQWQWFTEAPSSPRILHVRQTHRDSGQRLRMRKYLVQEIQSDLDFLALSHSNPPLVFRSRLPPNLFQRPRPFFLRRELSAYWQHLVLCGLRSRSSTSPWVVIPHTCSIGSTVLVELWTSLDALLGFVDGYAIMEKFVLLRKRCRKWFFPPLVFFWGFLLMPQPEGSDMSALAAGLGGHWSTGSRCMFMTYEVMKLDQIS